LSVAEAVRASGYPAVRLAEVLNRGVDDRTWLTYTAEKRFIALTKDKNLGRIPLSIGTVLASKARVVTFSVGTATGPELAALVSRVIPAIRYLGRPSETSLHLQGDGLRSSDEPPLTIFLSAA
jgi:hypothetical protein